MIFGTLLKTGRNEVLPYLLPASSPTPWLVVESPCVSLPRCGLPNRLAQVATCSVKFLDSPRFKTSPCVPATGRHVFYMWACCRYTRGRFERTHGSVLNLHTGGGGRREGVIASSAYQKCPTWNFHFLQRGSPKETFGSYPFKI